MYEAQSASGGLVLFHGDHRSTCISKTVTENNGS